jgi:hypothetical protein
MIEIGKLYTGNEHCFRGTIKPIAINPETNELRVELEYQGSIWQETWNLEHTNWGLELGEYYELGSVHNSQED